MAGQAGHDGKGRHEHDGLVPCMTGQNVIMNILTCHPERSEGSFAKESSKRFFADAQNDRKNIRDDK